MPKKYRGGPKKKRYMYLQELNSMVPENGAKSWINLKKNLTREALMHYGISITICLMKILNCTR